MVSKSANQSKTLKHKHFWLLLLLFFIVAGVSIAICYLVRYFMHNDTLGPISDEESSIESDTFNEENVVQPAINIINYQTAIDDFVNSTNGNRSVIIYDLDINEVVGSYNQAENYSTASLYKLFVVYEGYRRIDSGIWDPAEKAGTTGYSILECLDLAIRESHSPCAETLWAKIGHAELDKIVKDDFNIQNSDISHLSSNPEDIMKIMQLFYLHPDIKNIDLITQMKDSFLIQPTTIYNWRQGLPSGFSQANVYNKVGWDYNPNGKYWNIYHDAAIVEFPEENRHYIVVVMTNKIPFQKISEFGSNIEQTFYNSKL